VNLAPTTLEHMSDPIPPAGPAKIRVLIVDDHMVVRVGLRTILEGEPDLEVVAEAGDGPGALAAFDLHQPDIVLLDLRMPDVNGADLIKQLRVRDPGAKVIVLTSYDADEDIYREVQAGARGYLLKGTLPDGILEEAIRTVHAGRRLIPADVADRLANRLSTPALTPREIAVLELVAKGLSNAEIGVALSVSAGTIKTHLKRIYPKLGVADRTAAALAAVQRGIVTLR
jgi:two-component system NarL family response regulator